MSNLVKYAESELQRAGMGPNDKTIDPVNQAMGKCVVDVVKTFSKQGHSGFSASYATGLIEKLLRYEPLGPLTGEDDEWMDCTGGLHKTNPRDIRWQNKRDFRVFKREDGTSFMSDGKIFRDKDGSTWNNSKSSVDIKKWPYTPKVKVIERRWWKFWL